MPSLPTRARHSFCTFFVDAKVVESIPGVVDEDFIFSGRGGVICRFS